jgi:hypothetical protein
MMFYEVSCGRSADRVLTRERGPSGADSSAQVSGPRLQPPAQTPGNHSGLLYLAWSSVLPGACRASALQVA